MASPTTTEAARERALRRRPRPTAAESDEEEEDETLGEEESSDGQSAPESTVGSSPMAILQAGTGLGRLGPDSGPLRHALHRLLHEQGGLRLLLPS